MGLALSPSLAPSSFPLHALDLEKMEGFEECLEYHFEADTQFWSGTFSAGGAHSRLHTRLPPTANLSCTPAELADVISISPSSSLDRLDYALRNYVALTSRYLGPLARASPISQPRVLTFRAPRRRVPSRQRSSRPRSLCPPRFPPLHLSRRPNDGQHYRLHPPLRHLVRPLCSPHAHPPSRPFQPSRTYRSHLAQCAAAGTELEGV